MSLTRRVGMFFLLGAAAVALALAEPSYTIIDLGVVGVGANGLNNVGDVAGNLSNSGFALAFLSVDLYGTATDRRPSWATCQVARIAQRLR